MNDLTEWLRAQLDEEEREAKEAADLVAIIGPVDSFNLAAFFGGGSVTYPAWATIRVQADHYVEARLIACDLVRAIRYPGFGKQIRGVHCEMVTRADIAEVEC